MKNARTNGVYEDIWTSRDKCVFCDLKDKYILYEEHGVVLTISLYPYIDGHIMAIPRRHVQSNKELTQLEWETMRKFSYLAKKMFKKVHGYKGMWTLVKDGAEAQSTVGGHLHMHFIPFDKTDLCTWNYRELQFTPLENAQKYRDYAQKFVAANQKFETKYKQRQLLPVVVDLIIINTEGEVLLQERKQFTQLKNNTLTFPGGHIDADANDLLAELKREVKEELGYEIETKQVELLTSEISNIEYNNPSKHLQTVMPINHRFIWNIYILKDFDKQTKLTASDDCEALLWMKLDDAMESGRISKGMKALLKKYYEKLHD